MSRRRGSATALKASEVVAALAIWSIYSHTRICQLLFLSTTTSSSWWQSPRPVNRNWLMQSFAKVCRTLHFEDFRTQGSPNGSGYQHLSPRLWPTQSGAYG